MVNEAAQEHSNSINEPNMNEAADTEISERYSDKDRCCLFCFSMTALIVAFLIMMSFYIEKPQKLYFSLGITSIEGLSPSSSCQTCTTLSPTFTLVLSAHNSHNHVKRRCFIGGETREFYQLVEIAAGPIGEFCVEKAGEKDMTVHAWSMELELPAFLRDQLYEETMKHQAVFYVELLLDRDSDVDPLILGFHVGN